jgi:uncharacterized protein
MSERLKQLESIIKKLHDGVPVEAVKKEFKDAFGSVSADELAAAERKLVENGLPIEEVQRLCDVHASVFEGNISQIHSPKSPDTLPGHPAFVFRGENTGLARYLEMIVRPAMDNYARDPRPGTLTALHDALTGLQKLDRHYKRKENLLFPYLEKAGITAPPKVMWGVDDGIRALTLKALAAALQPGNAETAVRLTNDLCEKIAGMIVKETEILMPMLLKHLTPDDWELVARESLEIGYCFNGGVEGASPSDASAWLQSRQQPQQAAEKLPAHDYNAWPPEPAGGVVIGLPSGNLCINELISVLNALPADITFVDADNKVKYYSEGRHRVFPRTRTIIGRDVSACHPPKSLKAVEQVIKNLREGVKDEENFWIQRGGLFILIRYLAVRDENGLYLGVLEVTEEMSGIRKLTGEKTLQEPEA